jgi:hypothetical protein
MRGQPFVAVFRDMVVILPGFRCRIYVNGCTGEVLQVVKKFVLVSHGNRMTCLDRERRVNGHVDLCMEPVAEPPDLHIGNHLYTLNMAGSVGNLIGDCRINTVNQPGKYCLPRFPDNSEDCNRDEQPDNGICEREPKVYAGRPKEHGETRQTIGPGVQTVGHERCAADLVADPYTELGRRFVPDEPDDRRCCHCPEKSDFLRVEEPVDGKISGNDRGRQDHEDDKDAGEIFDPSVPVREPFRRLSPGEEEGEEERDCRKRIAEVMDSVSEERDTAGVIDDNNLKERGEKQADEGPLDCPDPTFRCEDGRVHDAVGVVMTAVFFRTVIVPVVVVMVIVGGWGLFVFLENHVTVPISLFFA